MLTFSNTIFPPTAYFPALIYLHPSSLPFSYKHKRANTTHGHFKTHGLPRNRKSTTCAICWPKSVLHEEKRRTHSDSGAGATKMCRTSSDIGGEQENHNVGRGPM